ncbi:MAG: Crp/Fnr family transcriptional regulator [Bacteroidetes bacterium]|nr:Crp/Fnr family transcriptional regulator [Bacteroidota bacterium]
MNREEQYDCSNCIVSMKSIFCELNSEEALAVSESKRRIVFRKGETIYTENTFPRYLYCISKGKVKITQKGVDGIEQIIQIANNGDLIGYRAILSGEKYTRTAVTIEESFVCLIPAEIFLTCVRNNPKFALRTYRLFSKELQEAEKKIFDITHRTVTERIAHSLLLFSETYGFENDGSTLKLIIKREDLASIAGTTRETATRILFEMQSKKIIGLSGKKIKIINLAELVKSAKLNL